MDELDRVIQAALTDWPEDDDFFAEWHRFINGPITREAKPRRRRDRATLGLPRRQDR